MHQQLPAGPIPSHDLQGPRSVDQLLHAYQMMDVPHFQRGLVWERGNIEQLLESLYLNTPCGSIILWNPPPEFRPADAPEELTYLIVDGQQRLRSLNGVFRTQETVPHDVEEASQPPISSDEEDDEDLRAKRIWCLNLGRLEEFGAFTGGKRFGLFRYTTDPRNHAGANAAGAPLQDREALLPLRWFLAHSDEDIRRQIRRGPDELVAKAALAVLNNEQVKQRLRQMCQNPVFQVTVLPSSRSLVEVIGIYNRINSAGKRVEAEERAFASVVGASADQTVNRFLEDFFLRVHGARHESRDDLLDRQRENRFGFKLFMRVFTITLSYHSDRSLGSAAFSFDAINPRTLEKAKPHIPELLKTTVRILDEVARIVRGDLFCDDLRMLSDTSSLWPIFQLLIRFPGLATSEDAMLRSLCLRLLISRPTNPELLAACRMVNGGENSRAALKAVNDLAFLQPRTLARDVAKGVGEAQSINNRYALSLYWLIRRRRGKDFSYEANKAAVENINLLRKKYPTEPDLGRVVNAEKQHIVPYKRLKDVFELTTGPRLGSHFVNNIGNLTYISELLNGFAVGIGSRALNLDAEPEGNLKAHFLRGDDPDLLRLYRLACTETKRKAARSAYQAFCAARRKLIASAFVEWAEELSSVDAANPAPQLPSPRLVSPTDVDLIVSVGFHIPVTAALMKLRLRGDARSTPERQKQDGEVRFAVVRRRLGGRSTQRLRVDINQSAGRIELKVSDPVLQEWCINQHLAADENRTKDALRVILPAEDDSVGPLLEALDAVLTETSHTEGSVGQPKKFGKADRDSGLDSETR